MNDALNQSICINNYKDMAARMLTRSFPLLDSFEIDRAIDYSIEKRYKNGSAELYNNYKNRTVQSSLLEMTDYILSRQPIVTPYGTLFQKHAEGTNPFFDLINGFLEARNVHKAEMFKYPKGTADYQKYNLFQLLDKIDAKIVGVVKPL